MENEPLIAGPRKAAFRSWLPERCRTTW